MKPKTKTIPLEEIPAPPDGGWGWVVCFASFLCNMILDGIAYSFGILLGPLVIYFDSNRSTVSWVGSLLCGVYMASGPIVGGLVNKFGCRHSVWKLLKTSHFSIENLEKLRNFWSKKFSANWMEICTAWLDVNKLSRNFFEIFLIPKFKLKTYLDFGAK